MKITLLTILLFIAVTETGAQERLGSCITNRNGPPVNSFYWPPVTMVGGYFLRDLFISERRTSLFAPMKTWLNAAAASRAGISFSYAGEVDRLAIVEGCLTVIRRRSLCRSSEATTQPKPAVVNEGEEPVEDNTPVVVPKP